MAEVLKAILEALKLAPRYLGAVAIAAAILLFSDASFLKRLGVYDFTNNYRSWIGLTFLASTVLFATDRAVAATGWFRRKRNSKFRKKHQITRLNNLTEDEKQILRYYIAKGTKTNSLKCEDGVVQGLAAAGIIVRMSPMGHIIDGFAYNITDFAWDYLHVNHWVLDGSTNLYRTDKKERERW